jgi:hypothetical protein
MVGIRLRRGQPALGHEEAHGAYMVAYMHGRFRRVMRQKLLQPVDDLLLIGADRHLGVRCEGVDRSISVMAVPSVSLLALDGEVQIIVLVFKVPAVDPASVSEVILLLPASATQA